MSRPETPARSRRRARSLSPAPSRTRQLQSRRCRSGSRGRLPGPPWLRGPLPPARLPGLPRALGSLASLLTLALPGPGRSRALNTTGARIAHPGPRARPRALRRERAARTRPRGAHRSPEGHLCLAPRAPRFRAADAGLPPWTASAPPAAATAADRLPQGQPGQRSLGLPPWPSASSPPGPSDCSARPALPWGKTSPGARCSALFLLLPPARLPSLGLLPPPQEASPATSRSTRPVICCTLSSSSTRYDL